MKERKEHPSSAELIAYQIEDGEMLPARAALINGQTQLSAAILTIDVIAILANRLPETDRGERWFAAAAKVRRTLTRGT